MKSLIVIVILIGLVYWAFKAGKREGSVKGYGVGVLPGVDDAPACRNTVAVEGADP